MKTKAGKVAKRQPQYDERPKSYYQAQCSFRGLKTSGGKDELQQLLQHRDLRKDLEIQDELDQLDSDINAYGEEQEELRLEEWWKDPATTFEDRLLQSPERALQEEMQNPDSFLLHSCRILRGHWYGLSRATAALSLGYEAVSGPVDLPPDCEIQQCYIIGEAKAVATNARAFKKKNAEKKAQEQWTSHNTKLEVAKAEKRARHRAFSDEAKANDDWDLTGKWTIHCDELSQYRTGPQCPEKLSMEIFRDDYKLNAVCVDEAESDSEDHYSYEYFGGNSERRGRAVPAPESAADSQRPRYCAKFYFGVVKGIMRIYPSTSTSSSPEWTTVKDNPTFQLRWRGRETGEDQIELEALDYQPRSITFSDSGLKVEGMFDCPYISGPLRFTGKKKSHGRGQTLSSAEKWRGLN